MALEVYDEIGAPDDLDYYGGKKWPWLVSLGPVRRALSDHKGSYEVGRFTVSWADPERRIRKLLASGPGKYTPGKTVAAYLVSEEGRRNKVTPRLMAWGAVEGGPRYGANLTIDLTCRDVVGGSNKNWGLDGASLIPKRIINSVEFPEVREEVKDFGVPFPLGVLNDELVNLGGSNVPVITGNVDKDRGFQLQISTSGGLCGDWSGFGDTNGPAPPTDLVVSEVLSAGIDIGHDAHDALSHYISITSVDADGVEGDAEPFYDGVGITLTARDSAIHVEWTASPAAVKYRVYMGWAWYGLGWNQYIETTGTSCDFTKQPDWEGELIITEAMITPGAHLCPGGIWSGWYRVSALFANGVESSMSDSSGISPSGSVARWATSKPYRRPTRLEWLPVTDAIGYRIYRTGIWGPIDTMFDVPGTQCYFDDWNIGGTTVPTPEPPHGAYEPIYVGDVTLENQTWRELLVAGCAIKDISDWYYQLGEDPIEKNLGDGTDYLIPFTASWDARFPTSYRDIAGTDGVVRRRTVIYARGTKGDALADGTARFRINLEGVEDVGNGSGDCLTDLYDQTIWFFEQLVLQDYLTGDYTCPPTFPNTDICQINRPSFRAVRDQRRTEVGGGYLASWIIGAGGERVSAQAWIQRICESGQFRVGPNRFWQLKAWALNENLSLVGLLHIRDDECVDKGDGDPIPHFDHLANVLEYTYGPPFDEGGDWLGTKTIKNDASITAYGQEYKADTLELYCLRIASIAGHAASQYLLYSRLIPHTIEATGDLRFTNFDLGDAFLYDHYRGLGDTDGYVDRPFVVIGHTFRSQGRQIQLECLDLGEIVAP